MIRDINKIDDDTVLVNLIFCIDNKNADMPFDMDGMHAFRG